MQIFYLWEKLLNFNDVSFSIQTILNALNVYFYDTCELALRTLLTQTFTLFKEKKNV